MVVTERQNLVRNILIFVIITISHNRNFTDTSVLLSDKLKFVICRNLWQHLTGCKKRQDSGPLILSMTNNIARLIILREKVNFVRHQHD